MMILLNCQIQNFEEAITVERKNNYPFVLVHGFLCFGDEQLLNDLTPNFGMFAGNAAQTVRSLGVECYCPSIGPFSSAWDRACELYAKIRGGRVDYGKVHSERYGHARYGRTHSAMIPDWGTLDEKGRLRKINIIAHSFGGPTISVFLDLLAKGSEEERQGTPENELSDLFKGGKEKWVHTFTALAATFNGVTLEDAAEPLVMPFETLLIGLGATLGRSPFSRLYDFHLDHFGISDPRGSLIPKVSRENFEGVKHYTSLHQDNIFYELTISGAKEIMDPVQFPSNIYYFTHWGCRTRPLDNTGFQIPAKNMLKPLMLFSIFECLWKKPDPSWMPNDGLVNIPSAVCPMYKGIEPEPFEDTEKCLPGHWYTYPTEDKDHTSFMGLGETPEAYADYFLNLAQTALAMPETD